MRIRQGSPAKAPSRFLRVKCRPGRPAYLTSRYPVLPFSPMSEPDYFDWDSIFSAKRWHLPHLCQENVVYFVTFRLADSIPQTKLQFWRYQYEQWLAANPRPHSPQQVEQAKALTIRKAERFLDRGFGQCVLREACCQDSVESVLRNRDGTDYALGDFVIMPNHVHVLFRPVGRCKLGTLVGPWRSISAKEINRHLARQGTLWQPEPFDHIVRSAETLARFRRYIESNPRGLPPDSARYGCGSLFEGPP